MKDVADRSLARKNRWTSTATTLNNLAFLCKDQGKLAEAESLYRRAYSILEKAFGEAHPKVTGLLKNYVPVLRMLNRGAEADRLEEKMK